MPPPGGPEHSRLTVRTLCLDVAPAFTQLPVDTTVTDGMTAVLRCEVSGAPRPAIVWSRGRRLAPASGGEPGGAGLPLLLPFTRPFCDEEDPGEPDGRDPIGAHRPKRRPIALPRAGSSFLLRGLRQCLGPGGPLNEGVRFQPLCEGGWSQLGECPLLL